MHTNAIRLTGPTDVEVFVDVINRSLVRSSNNEYLAWEGNFHNHRVMQFQSTTELVPISAHKIEKADRAKRNIDERAQRKEMLVFRSSRSPDVHLYTKYGLLSVGGKLHENIVSAK